MEQKNWMIVIFLFAVFPALCLAVRLWKNRRLQKIREKARRERGREGEEDTLLSAKQIRGYKRLLQNVYLPKGEGPGTVEIDIIVIHQKGIIVIENKNYAGWIDGRERAETWLQICGKTKRTFYSPVWQNQNHIRYLKRLLDSRFDAPIPYVSVITFNDRARLSRKALRQREAIVTYSRRAAGKLNWLLFGSRKVLKKSEVEEIYQWLKPCSGGTKSQIKAHREQAKLRQRA